MINKWRNLIVDLWQEKWFFKVVCSRLIFQRFRFHGDYGLSSMKPFPVL